MELDYDANMRVTREWWWRDAQKSNLNFCTNRRVIDVLNNVLQVREASPRLHGTKKDGSGMHKNQIWTLVPNPCIHITYIFNELLQACSGMPKNRISIFVLNEEVPWSSHGTKNGGSGMHVNQIWTFTPNRTDRTYNRHLRRHSTSTHDDCGMPKNWIQIFVPILQVLA
jgi:hypothetical protein